MDLLKVIPDSQVDLVIADPPYFEVMVTDHLGNRYEWDKQWESFDDYLDWCKLWLAEVKRILKPNGSIYIFQDDKNCAYVQIVMDKLGLNLENNITWVKPNNMAIKGWDKFRCYSPITERILFYSKESRNRNLENDCYAENVKIFTPIIEYMLEQKRKIKEYFCFKTDEQFNEYMNKISDTKSVVSRHYFTYSQWVFPTKEIYQKLQSINNEIFKKEYEIFKKEYEIFKKEYEIFKKEYEEKRRTFNPKKNYTDVWTYNITSSQEDCVHPCQKPIALIRRIIETSSKENDLVVDLFVGSGTVPLACQQLQRRWVGSEKDNEYIPLINLRLNQTNIHHFSNTLLSQPSAEGSLISALTLNSIKLVPTKRRWK